MGNNNPEKIDHSTESLLNAEQVADMIGIKLSTLYNWTHRNCIPHLKLSGRILRFREKQILEWISEKSIHPKISKEHQKAAARKSSGKGTVTDDYVRKLVDGAVKETLKK